MPDEEERYVGATIPVSQIIALDRLASRNFRTRADELRRIITEALQAAAPRPEAPCTE